MGASRCLGASLAAGELARPSNQFRIAVVADHSRLAMRNKAAEDASEQQRARMCRYDGGGSETRDRRDERP